VKVAAYQAPLLPSGSLEASDLIRKRVEWCEAQGVAILCCPEAILGGLADYATNPSVFALDAGEQLSCALAPLASDTVTTIVGFTEVTGSGTLHNTAAVYHRGSIIGLYRKLYPAINRSIYEPGDQMPVFQVDDLVFGIVICNDSNYAEPARVLAARGATALFVPTNNGLPPEKTSADLVDRARNCDITRAIENRVWVIRADVAGSASGLTSGGASGIVDPDGVVRSAARLKEDLLVAEIGGVRPSGVSFWTRPTD
jgi:predicted amidohydrolase